MNSAAELLRYLSEKDCRRLLDMPVSNFKKGDRVKYVGASMPNVILPQLKGDLGTVDRIMSGGTVRVKWDNIHCLLGEDEKDLELIPVEFAISTDSQDAYNQFRGLDFGGVILDEISGTGLLTLPEGCKIEPTQFEGEKTFSFVEAECECGYKNQKVPARTHSNWCPLHG
jgi:hypothetical protein